ncbi:hypothetical protein CAP35_13395 [Chitinophagaceae bacterium IBVUCB1]|nr:hypothetical protein CAP35_13395 [Chitinophagaceae bacterium IBVUCB1]
MRYITYILTILLCCNNAFAQTYNQVTHTTGVQAIATVQVTVSAVGGASIYSGGSCGAGPYHIGNGVGGAASRSGYLYSFNQAVREVRFQVTASEPGEEISINVNGNNYTLTAANISNFSGSCGTNGNSAISGSGTVIFTGGGNNNTTIRIIDSIRSIRILNKDTIAGSVYNMHFVMDTTVTMSYITDTLWCAGDSIEIPYTISGSFASNNQFIFQLSDRYGSFSSPTIIATIPDNKSGICKAIMPAVPSSTGYKIRVVATHPAYTSTPNALPLAIGNKPVGAIFNTGPACQGAYAQIGYHNFSHFTEVQWSRQGTPVFSKLQYHGFQAVKMSDAGMYIGEMQDYGCSVYDTTVLIVKPNPLKAISTNNSPLCIGDTLMLKSAVDSPGAMNVWVHPDGTTTDTSTIWRKRPATYTDAGKYVLITVLDGCVAFDTTFVVVKHRPETGLEDINACLGDSLRIRITDPVPGTKCIWQGPNGFVCYAKDTVLKPVTHIANGLYTVVAELDGCVATDSMAVQIKALPPVPAAPSDTTICAGQSLILQAYNTQQGVQYTWVGPGGFTIKEYDFVVKNMQVAGSGKYVIIADRDGCVKTDTFTATVKPAPAVPDIYANSPVRRGETLTLKLLNKEDGVLYTWQGPAGFRSSLLQADIVNIMPEHGGTYTMLADKQGCISSGILQVVVTDVADTGYVLLYPNPNNGNFMLKGLFGRDIHAEVRILNAAGQEVYHQNIPTNNKMLQVNIQLAGTLASGLYQLRLAADGKFYTLRFVVNRQ